MTTKDRTYGPLKRVHNSKEPKNGNHWQCIVCGKEKT
mgnify:CR=1 FL=1